MATLIFQHVDNPLEFGVVITDDEGRIRRFLEKPSWGEVFSDTVNTGMYILEPSIFEYMQPEKSYDWSQDIFPQILKEEKPMFGYIMGEYWTDVGSLAQYRQAQYEMLGGKTTLPIEGRREGGDIWIGEGTEIDPSAQIIGPVLIGKNCRIKRQCPHRPGHGDRRQLPDRRRRDHCSEPIVWDSNYIGKRTQLTGCTVCFRNTIKDDVTIQEGAVVGDRCHIESGSTLRPLIKLWPDKVIEAGSVVTMSLIWGSKWQGALFRDLGVSGIANVEMTPDFATKLGASYGAFLKKGSTVITSAATRLWSAECSSAACWPGWSRSASTCWTTKTCRCRSRATPSGPTARRAASTSAWRPNSRTWPRSSSSTRTASISPPTASARSRRSSTARTSGGRPPTKSARSTTRRAPSSNTARTSSAC